MRKNNKLIITSAAYCDAEMQAEMGKLPPSFLPIGNKRLYELQHALASRHSDAIFLTLPESFNIPAHDLTVMKRLGIELIFLPEDYSLGHAIIYALNLAGIFDEPVQLLHGDTLFDDLPDGELDIFSIAHTSDSYRWTTYHGEKDQKLSLKTKATVQSPESSAILSGYFSFSSASELVKALVSERGNFIDGLIRYHTSRRLSPRDLPRWSDFGHINTYYKSRKSVSTQRAFNAVNFETRMVEKSSTDTSKMEAERNWFENLPPSMRIYTPNFLGRMEHPDVEGYRTENLNLLPLNDLYVFGNLHGAIWEQIFDACSVFLSDCQSTKPTGKVLVDAEKLYLTKTLSRLDEYSKSSNFKLSEPITLNGSTLPSIIDIAEKSAKLIPAFGTGDAGIMHGDFCFSNVFYDFRANGIKAIDPRGFITPGKYSVFGDTRYDVAKLFHSVVGLYDYILAGRFEYQQSNDYNFHFSILEDSKTSQIIDGFLGHKFGRYTGGSSFLIAIGIQLFLSMLPLHSDKPSRQKAFLANAARLFLMLK